MNRNNKSQAIAISKKRNLSEVSYTTMWILASFPLLALTAISILMIK